MSKKEAQSYCLQGGFASREKPIVEISPRMSALFWLASESICDLF